MALYENDMCVCLVYLLGSVRAMTGRKDFIWKLGLTLTWGKWVEHYLGSDSWRIETQTPRTPSMKHGTGEEMNW